MTKDVLITIRGVHTMDEEDNDVEMIVRGEWETLRSLRRTVRRF